MPTKQAEQLARRAGNYAMSALGHKPTSPAHRRDVRSHPQKQTSERHQPPSAKCRVWTAPRYPRGEELQHVRATQLTTDDDLPGRIDAVDLKYRLRDIQSYCHNLRHDLLPSLLDRLQRTLRYVGACERRRPRHQNADIGRWLYTEATEW
jgi:hypothetical protein